MQDLSRLLNIIRVVLNILAGAMLAPEAIGVERIRRWEQKTEITSERILMKIENVNGFLNRLAGRFDIDPFDSGKG